MVKIKELLDELHNLIVESVNVASVLEFEEYERLLDVIDKKKLEIIEFCFDEVCE